MPRKLIALLWRVRSYAAELNPVKHGVSSERHGKHVLVIGAFVIPLQSDRVRPHKLRLSHGGLKQGEDADSPAAGGEQLELSRPRVNSFWGRSVRRAVRAFFDLKVPYGDARYARGDGDLDVVCAAVLGDEHARRSRSGRVRPVRGLQEDFNASPTAHISITFRVQVISVASLQVGGERYRAADERGLLARRVDDKRRGASVLGGVAPEEIPMVHSFVFKYPLPMSPTPCSWGRPP